MNVAIIGGGAAGFFSAITAKTNFPEADVTIFEKSHKVLSKLKISGGGRCNVTNGCESIPELAKAYPRGSKQLKKLFRQFNNKHTMEWFESRGVSLVIQDDNCVFPVSQDSQTIIDCFLEETNRLGVAVELQRGVRSLSSKNDKIIIGFSDEIREQLSFDKVIVTTGGSPQRKGLQWLEDLGHEVADPVPSLFTFNMPQDPVRELMGVVVENAWVRIQGTKCEGSGPLLITHWGMSGPAVLVASSYGARVLSEMNYEFQIQVNWVNEFNAETVHQSLKEIIASNSQKQLSNFRPYKLPDRLWLFLLKKIGLDGEKKWGDVGKKGLNKLVNVLTNDVYEVKGKTGFRDEFVTCGGVSLQSVNMKTMESKVCPNLYFAGEVLDVDAITGGYNFQAAWTTGYVAGQLNG